MKELEIVEKWRKIGLLEGLDDNKSKLIANAFETMMQYLLKIENEIGETPKGTVQIFPILRRILSKIDVEQSNLNIFVINLYELFIEEYLTVDITKSYYDIIDSDNELDELCKFCDNFIKQYNEKAIK